MQLLLSIFIGWTILLSRVKADYSSIEIESSHPSVTPRYIRKHIERIGPKVANIRRSERVQNKMKPATIVGILLIILGIIGFATGGLSFTHQKKVVDAGPIQISHETQDTLPISPILSTISLVAGVALVVVGARGR
jgi:hypothetical protein